MTLSIVKFGGSAITVKERPFTVRKRALRSMCSQVLNHVKRGGRVVVVHGGGSFGHPLAMAYKLSEGLVNSDSYVGVSLTRLAMRRLNEVVVKEFVRLGGRPFTIEPSSSFILEEEDLKRNFIEGVEVALEKGFIPILHGDVVLDKGRRSVSILSGDTIASTLALSLKADKLIYVLDVNGIYLEDPKKKPDAKLIRFLSESMLSRIRSTSDVDATGGLARKIREAFKAFHGGVRVVCFINWRRNNLLKALEGLGFKGTIIKED
ncbi:MAG: isopentenyl phosphate kinase [Candidatus Nezhaarchaeales archaeon]|nr:isopentenyl phosphate kinase [Candidatus Nezhaarchaeota archaeon]